MGLRDLFSKRTETSEKHAVEPLKTRYYKASKGKALKAIRRVLEADSRVQLLDVLEDHGEITAQFQKPKKAFVVASAITVFPFRTAIDFTVTTQTMILPSDFGFSRKAVLHFYKKLDQELEFVGVGLAENHTK